MKKIVSLVLVCVLLMGTVFALASCGKTLSGEYKDELTGLVTMKFSGKKVTSTTKVAGISTSTEAEYKIEKDPDDADKLVITFSPIGDKESNTDLKGSVPFEEVDSKTIKIAGLTYKKA